MSTGVMSSGVVRNLATGEERHVMCEFLETAATPDTLHGWTGDVCAGHVLALDRRGWQEEHLSDAPLEMTLHDGREYGILPPISTDGTFSAWIFSSRTAAAHEPVPEGGDSRTPSNQQQSSHQS